MNKVFVNQYDIIEIVVSGDQTVDAVDDMAKRSYELVDSQHQSGKPALLLNNLLTMGDIPPEARKLVVKYARTRRSDKFAIVGKGETFRFTANLLLQAMRRDKSAKYFDDYDEAVKWLLTK